MPRPVLEQFAATRVKLDAVCDLLLAPSAGALDECSGLLEGAARQLAACQGEAALSRGNPEAIEAVRDTRRSFLRAARLLENAAHFHTNWMAIRGAMTGGYTGRGEPAPVRHPRRISVEA